MARTRRGKFAWRGGDWVPRMAVQTDWEEVVIPEFALPAQVGYLWHQPVCGRRVEPDTVRAALERRRPPGAAALQHAA